MFNFFKKQQVFGCRIPKDFFTTKGKGESDITVHAGSYHLALKDANIEMCNIITYSSILPVVANETKKPNKLTHGSVLETIMAVSTATKNKRATAAIMYGWLYDKETGEKYGGLVCEYNGPLTVLKAYKQLRSSLDELYYNGFSDKYILKDFSFINETIVPKKNFGTVVVALCFTNYIFPSNK